MANRVLIINRQLAFSVALKQALERTGAFDVHPFTTADAAIEYLQAHQHDVALIDLNSAVPQGAGLIDTLRRIQPGLPVVVSPKQTEAVQAQLAIQESIDPPFSARDVIPLLNRAIESSRHASVTRVLPDEPPVKKPKTGSPSSNVPPPEKRLRPGEIGEGQLRPYMYSTDLFRQRQEEQNAEPLPPDEMIGPSTDVFRERPADEGQRLRPGEFDEAALRSLLEGRDPSAPELPVTRPARREGEILPGDLPPVSTDVFHGEQDEPSSIPPLERPDRRRTSAFTTESLRTPEDPPGSRPGEFTEQDLLNLVLNRAADEREAPVRPGEYTEDQLRDFQITTDIFKGSEESASAISPEDAAAMWEQLTGEQAEAPSFDFDDFTFDDEGDTPLGLEPVVEDEQPRLTEAQEMPPLVIDEPAFKPPSATATHLISTQAENLEASIQDARKFLQEPETPSWDFPDQQFSAPAAPPPQESPADYDFLDELVEQDALLGEPEAPPKPLSTTEQLNADYALPFDELIAPPLAEPLPVPPDVLNDDVDYFTPVDTAELMARWSAEQPPEPEDSQQSERLNVTPLEEVPADDPGVRQLEAIAEEIRRTRETDKLREQAQTERADTIFHKLAAEEPPMPDALDEGGTVGDLHAGVQDPGFQSVLQLLRGEEVEIKPPSPTTEPDDQPVITQSEIEEIFSAFVQTPDPVESDGDDLEESNRAQVILETALDESTPADSFSLQSLIASIERQLDEGNKKPSVRPLPSWSGSGTSQPLRDDLYVREPDFLPDVIAEVDSLPRMDESDPFGDATTFAGGPLASAHDLETEWLASGGSAASMADQDWTLEPAVSEEDTDGVTKPLESAAEAPPQVPPFELPELEQQEPEYNTEFERLAALDLYNAEPSDYTPPMGMPAIQDPYIAQIALSLTQISLGEIAAAVLSRNDEVIAFTGQMGRDDIEEVAAAIDHQWDNHTDQANVRFITLPSSGKDYMLYSRRTVNELTLSLAFPGATPLRDIRRQGKRLAEALMAVPEAADAIDSAYQPEAGKPASDVHGMYTYVWLLRDPNYRLSDVVARAIEAGMSVQLRERGWNIVNLQARDELVYLLADVPGDAPPFEIVRDLKRRAAEIARKQNPALSKTDLWADSYLVITPGRELDEDEIQQFIQFERMV